MSISLGLLTVYLLGGITFLPLLSAIIFLHAYLTFPEWSSSPSACTLPSDLNNESHIETLDGSSDNGPEYHATGIHESDVASGYFAVCREYVPGGINGKPPERLSPAGTTITAESPSVYQSMYRTIFDRRQAPSLDLGKSSNSVKTFKRARNVFFVVLRHRHLMLYEDAEQVEVKHVISLEHHNVSIYNGSDQIPEGELWIKRNAIKIQRTAADEADVSKPFFLFSDNCSDKEDFYFALLENQGSSGSSEQYCPPRSQKYKTKHIIGLVQRLHSSEEELQTRWINGLVGRLFLALYGTERLEEIIRNKVTKNISRVKKPAFLSSLVLQRIDMGEGAPHIINPRLKDLNVNGNCCIEADLKYSGQFRLEVAATARIDLGARLKAREVNLVLAVVIKRLNGHILMRLKAPPSNRLWIAFETMPDLEMSIEPIVSSRQITYGLILRAIDSRIREVLAETVVLPHWDDIPFLDTSSERVRGGIWERSPLQTTTAAEHIPMMNAAPEEDAFIPAETSILSEKILDKEERILSTPVLPDPASEDRDSTALGGLSRAKTNISSSHGVSTGVQKKEKPPKALRSRSFASAANPLLNMESVDSTSSETIAKHRSDATTAMIAIATRARPTSPTENWPEISKENADGEGNNPAITKMFDKGLGLGPAYGQQIHAPVSASDIGQAPSSPNSISLATCSSDEEPRKDVPWFEGSKMDSPMITKMERRPDKGFDAATATARKWSWNILARNGDQRLSPSPDPVRPDMHQHPMGRGQPLPPPGTPLPFPGNQQRKQSSSDQLKKRKPLPAPPLPLRRQDNMKPRVSPSQAAPTHRKNPPESIKNAVDDDLLIVAAPPDFEPPKLDGESSEQNSEDQTGHFFTMPRSEMASSFNDTQDGSVSAAATMDETLKSKHAPSFIGDPGQSS